MKRILYVFLTTLALLLLLSGCSSRHSESGSSHDETSVLTVELSSDSVSDSELKAFEEEVLTIHSDLQTEEMTVEAFKDLYHTSLPTLSQVPASYHQVDSVFVKAGEYPLVTQYWVDAQNKEFIVLSFFIGYEYPAEDQFGYDDQIVDLPTWVHYRGLYSTTFDGQMASVNIYMEKDRGEEYCKVIVTSLAKL